MVYQGLFKINNSILEEAQLIFPTTSFFERNSIYLNVEGTLRFAKRIITPFKFLFSDGEIARGLSLFKKKFLSHNFSVLRHFKFLGFFKGLISYKTLFVLEAAHFAAGLVYVLNLVLFTNLEKINVLLSFYDYLFYNTVINRAIDNYYTSDIFSKNSKIMSACALKVVLSNFSN